MEKPPVSSIPKKQQNIKKNAKLAAQSAQAMNSEDFKKHPGAG